MNALIHNRHGLVRVPWRLVSFILLTAGIALVLIFASSPLTIALMGGTEEAAGMSTETGLSNMNPWFVSLQNLLMIAAFLLASLILTRFSDKRPFASIGIGLHGKWIHELVIGLIMGAAFITLIVFIQVLTGSVQLKWRGFTTPVLLRECLPYAILFITIGFQEELLFRGYLLQTLAEGIGKVWATLLLSIPFGILHYFNEGGNLIGAVATGVAGVLLCIAYFKTMSLWLPIGMHITWNFTMSWIFGLPVSGEQLSNPPIQGIVGDPAWLSGGEFGPEGSVLCFAGMAAMGILILRAKIFAPCPRTVEWYPPPEERGRIKMDLPERDEPATT